MKTGQLIEQLAAVFAVVVVAGGSLIVLAPFMSALLWGAILAYCTWPVYAALLRGCGGRGWLAALLMILLFVALLLGPFVGVAISLAKHSADIASLASGWVAEGLPQLPQWIVNLPLAGAKIESYWMDLSHGGAGMLEQLRKFSAPIAMWLLDSGAVIGQGLIYMLLSITLAFFFYSGGVGASAWLAAGMNRIAGPERGGRLLDLIGNTVKGVVYGILGSALAQAILTTFGLAISGVPAAPVLGLLTFFLSVLPGGPALVWIPASIWLGSQGEMGWAVFMALWGVFVVSTVDNFIKPLVIGKSSEMPFVLIMLGVLGGALAFGFLGVFLGPTLLAVGYAVLREWTVLSEQDAAHPAPAPAPLPQEPQDGQDMG